MTDLGNRIMVHQNVTHSQIVENVTPDVRPSDLQSIASSMEVIKERVRLVADRLTSIYGEPVGEEKAEPSPAGVVPLMFGLVEKLDQQLSRLEHYVERL